MGKTKKLEFTGLSTAPQESPLRENVFTRLTSTLICFKKIGSQAYVKYGSCTAPSRMIAVMEIPIGAVVYKASSTNGDRLKCRASEAKVIAIYKLSECYGVRTLGPSTDLIGISLYSNSGRMNSRTRYVIGKTVRPDRFSTDSVACSGGIHFFENLSDALKYNV
jgi:hypothetical protein